MPNHKLSPIEDFEIEDLLRHWRFGLRSTLNEIDSFLGADFDIVANSTDINIATNCLVRNQLWRSHRTFLD